MMVDIQGEIGSHWQEVLVAMHKRCLLVLGLLIYVQNAFFQFITCHRESFSGKVS